MGIKRTRNRNKVPFKCCKCGRLEMIAQCRVKRKRFCSKICKDRFQCGIPKTNEVKKKISESKGGIKKETRVCAECNKEFEVKKWKKNRFCGRECSMRHVGKSSHHSPWNRGLPKDDPRVIENSRKQSESLKKSYESGNAKIWNKGLTAETDSRMAALTRQWTEMRNTEGEWKDKWRESMRKGQVEAWSQGKYKNCNTKPELITKAYLESLGFNVKPYSEKTDNDPENTWYQQYPFEETFNPDFACPDLKCIIEVDGCAYHAHDTTKCSMVSDDYVWPDFTNRIVNRDKRKHSMYYRHGWKWANVWECEALNGDFHRITKYLLTGE